MTETECACLAGIIEGEGCIRIDNVAQKAGAPKTGWRPTVHVTQKGRQLIEALNFIYPGQIIESHGPKHKNNFRIAWSWGKAYMILESILPYMRGPKKRQAELVLEFHKRINKTGPITEEEREWRLVQCKILGYLKKECI